MFYYYNGRLLITNGLLPVQDGEFPSASEKMLLKTIYECSKTQNHMALFLFSFYWHLTFLFGGGIGLSKDTIREPYKNLSCKSLSGEWQVEFDKISDLTAHINLKMKYSILSNIDDRDRAVKKKKMRM